MMIDDDFDDVLERADLERKADKENGEPDAVVTHEATLIVYGVSIMLQCDCRWLRNLGVLAGLVDAVEAHREHVAAIAAIGLPIWRVSLRSATDRPSGRVVVSAVTEEDARAEAARRWPMYLIGMARLETPGTQLGN
jgi:hypothetical protein